MKLKISNRFLGIVDLSMCNAVCKLEIESGVNNTGQTNIHLLIYLFIYDTQLSVVR